MVYFVKTEENKLVYITEITNYNPHMLDLIKKVDSIGFRLNLDVGTMIQNGENIDELKGNVSLINHVHISEPNLKVIQKRNLHNQLVQILKNEKYNKFVSIEMGKIDDINVIENSLKYVKEIFSEI